MTEAAPDSKALVGLGAGVLLLRRHYDRPLLIRPLGREPTMRRIALDPADPDWASGGTELGGLMRPLDGVSPWIHHSALAHAIDPEDTDLWYVPVSRSPFAAHGTGDGQARLVRPRGNG